tara:strand:+ start:252 stop:992 length:741 start_codon:yes stop_codon:yes gene_type:complete
MKKIMLVPLIYMFSCLTAYGEYAFEVVSKDADKDVVEMRQVNDTKVDMNTVVENYKKAMSNDNDLYIVRNQLDYNKNRERNIIASIDKLEKQLDSLPKIVKREYQQFDHMLKSTEDDIADNTWISFEDAFNKRQKELENRLSLLKSDLVTVRTRIAKLKMELETQETVANISNPFVQTDEEDIVDDNAKKALRAKNNLKDVVKKVTYKETIDLLGDVQLNTIGVCEFSCGRSDCYACNLLYGKEAK